MISTIYLSRAVRPLPATEIAALLQKSRETNARLGVTGLLLFNGRQFMQLLEGDDDEVAALYDRIVADSRHRDVSLLLNTPTVTRHYPEWSMAYRPITAESPRGTGGHTDFFGPSSGTGETRQSPSRAQWLLDWFRRRPL